MFIPFLENSKFQCQQSSKRIFSFLIWTFIHCANILPLKGLQLVSYDPFHGILTIERKPSFVRIYDAAAAAAVCISLWFYFFRWKFIVSKCLRKQSFRFWINTYVHCLFYLANIQSKKEFPSICLPWHLATRYTIKKCTFHICNKTVFCASVGSILHLSSKSVYFSRFHSRTLCMEWMKVLCHFFVHKEFKSKCKYECTELKLYKRWKV